MAQRPTRSVETLSCRLSNDELLSKSDEIANVLSEIDSKEDEISGLKKFYKSEVEKLDQRKNILKDQISTKRAYREVECSIEYNFDKKIKMFVRMDTGEIVREVPIAEHECQEYMKELIENVSESATSVSDIETLLDTAEFELNDETDSKEDAEDESKNVEEAI